MQIRSFTGPSLTEALGQVKAELGEDAIILTSRRPDDPSRLPEGHQYEVTAALPAAPAPRAPSAARKVRAWSPPRVDRQGRPVAEAPEAPARRAETRAASAPDVAVAEAPAEPAEDAGWMHVKRDLMDVRRELKDITRSLRFGEHGAWPADGDLWLQRLVDRGVPRAMACQLLDELPAQEETDGQRRRGLAKAIARRLSCAPAPQPVAGRMLVQAFVGPTGVGKTSAIAKLLLHPAGYGGRRGALLSLDTQRIAAVEQTRRLAGLARVRCEFAYRPDDLPRALERLAGADVLLVDTPGAGPGERLSRERILAFLRELKPAHLHLVLAAGQRGDDQLAACRQWKALGADRLLVTKLDETRSLGGLLELAAAGLPFGFAGTGQRIPGGFAALDADTLAGWILDPAKLHDGDGDDQ